MYVQFEKLYLHLCFYVCKQYYIYICTSSCQCPIGLEFRLDKDFHLSSSRDSYTFSSSPHTRWFLAGYFTFHTLVCLIFINSFTTSLHINYFQLLILLVQTSEVFFLFSYYNTFFQTTHPLFSLALILWSNYINKNTNIYFVLFPSSLILKSISVIVRKTQYHFCFLILIIIQLTLGEGCRIRKQQDITDLGQILHHKACC